MPLQLMRFDTARAVKSTFILVACNGEPIYLCFLSRCLNILPLQVMRCDTVQVWALLHHHLKNLKSARRIHWNFVYQHCQVSFNVCIPQSLCLSLHAFCPAVCELATFNGNLELTDWITIELTFANNKSCSEIAIRMMCESESMTVFVSSVLCVHNCFLIRKSWHFSAVYNQVFSSWGRDRYRSFMNWRFTQ